MHPNSGARKKPAARRLKRLPTLLRKARIEKNVSQLELARRSGVALSTIERYERGLGSPAVSTALRLCGVLAVDQESVMEAMRDDAASEVNR